jgi:hypothetical protein
MTLSKPGDIDDEASTDTVESPVTANSDAHSDLTVNIDGDTVSVQEAIERLQEQHEHAQERIKLLEQENAELREAVYFLGRLHDKGIELEL